MKTSIKNRLDSVLTSTLTGVVLLLFYYNVSRALIQKQVSEELGRREAAIVKEYGGKINEVRLQMGLPSIQVTNLADVVQGFFGPLASAGANEPKQSQSPK